MSAFVPAAIRAANVDALRPCSACRMKQVFKTSAARGWSRPAILAKFAAWPSVGSGGTGCSPRRRRVEVAGIVGRLAGGRNALPDLGPPGVAPSAGALAGRRGNAGAGHTPPGPGPGHFREG